MSLPVEFKADSVVTGEKNISINALVKPVVRPGKMAKIKATIHKPEDVILFYQLLRETYGITIAPRRIPIDGSLIEEADHNFSMEFGYDVKRMAVARLKERHMEAWIGPTLIHKDHPAYLIRDRHLVYLACEPNSEHVQNDGTPLALASKNQIVAAHYFRVMALDEPNTLSVVCSQLANHGINICEVRQPETGEKTGFTEIAFLIDPSSEERVKAAVKAVRKLDVVPSVNSVFKVVGHPTRDISRPYSNQT